MSKMMMENIPKTRQEPYNGFLKKNRDATQARSKGKRDGFFNRRRETLCEVCPLPPSPIIPKDRNIPPISSIFMDPQDSSPRPTPASIVAPVDCPLPTSSVPKTRPGMEDKEDMADGIQVLRLTSVTKRNDNRYTFLLQKRNIMDENQDNDNSPPTCDIEESSSMVESAVTPPTAEKCSEASANCDTGLTMVSATADTEEVPPLVTPPSCDTGKTMRNVAAIRKIVKNAAPARKPRNNAAAEVPPLVTPPSCDTRESVRNVAAVRKIMRNAAPARKPRNNAAAEVPPLVTPPSSDTRKNIECVTVGNRIAKFHVRPPRCDTQSTFILHRVLGEGGFGQVFLATDCATNKIVAIKSVVKTEDQREFIEIERNVFQMAAGCPYLTQLYTTFQTRDSACLVMEYVSGGDLYEFIVNHSPLDTSVIRLIAAEITCGLEFLHKRGIVHRDIKGNNILLDANGHIRIADYGLAVMDLYGDTKVRGVVGTPGYMAPEVVNGEFYQFEPDWFSMGVLIYMMATGTKPFYNHSMEDYTTDVNFYNPAYPPDMDPDLEDFIEGLLCKCPSKRLGVGRDIRRHPFMRPIDWKLLEQGRAEAPFSVGPPLDMDLEMHSRLPPSAIDGNALDIPGKKIYMPGFLNIDRL